MTLSPLLLLPMLAWSLSQAPEPTDATRKTTDQVNPSEDSPDAGRVTPELVKLWRKQAAQGGAQAQTSLGLLYSTGDGVPHDPREAIKWLRKAAEQGDGLGQLLLAAKYFEGAGVTRDPVKGMAWAILAAEKFHRVIDVDTGHATTSISPVIIQNLTLAEVNQVKQLASELRQKEVSRVKQLASELPPEDRARGAAFDLSHLLGDHPGTRIVVPRLNLSPPFAVGIVEANGNLVPIATFDGEDWSRFDLAGNWTLWYENPGPSPDPPHRAMAWFDRWSPVGIEIKITGQPPLCNIGAGIAMPTDAGDRRKSLIEEMRRRERCGIWGIATTSGVSRPNLVARLDPENEEDRRITAQILDTFNALENKAFERPHPLMGGTLSEHVGPRLNAEKRNRLPLRHGTVRVEGINATYYYIDVVRHYFEHLKHLEGFPSHTVLQGWARASADELVWITQSFGPEYSQFGDEDKANYLDTPTFFWSRGNVVDVLIDRAMWEGGAYIILTIDNDTVNEVVEVGYY